MNKIVQPQWLEWAKELQFIAQGGLTYSKDVFDIERFERIREIAAEMLSLQSGIPIEKVKNLFCNETGFQTPKLDTRAAIFKDDKILLVKEKNGTWSLPGGWVDINQSIKTNTEKEVKETYLTTDMFDKISQIDKVLKEINSYKKEDNSNEINKAIDIIKLYCDRNGFKEVKEIKKEYINYISTLVNDILIFPFISNKLVCVYFNLKLKYSNDELNNKFNEKEKKAIEIYTNNYDLLIENIYKNKQKNKEPNNINIDEYKNFII